MRSRMSLVTEESTTKQNWTGKQTGLSLAWAFVEGFLTPHKPVNRIVSLRKKVRAFSLISLFGFWFDCTKVVLLPCL